jgi:hypothetical protein
MYKHDDDDDDVFLCAEIIVWTRSLFSTSQEIRISHDDDDYYKLCGRVER